MDGSVEEDLRKGNVAKARGKDSTDNRIKLAWHEI